MEYFTLEKDVKEIRASKLKFQKRLFLFLFIFGSAFSLRSFGLISLEWNKGYLRGNHTSRKEIFKESNDGKDAEQNSTGENLTTDDENSYRNLGIKFNFPDSLPERKEGLEKLIKTKIAKENRLNNQFEFAVVSVKKFELSGLYWFPLIKIGESSYQILVENKLYSDSYSAKFEGNFEFQTFGFCTIHELEKINADKIAKIVVDSIKNDYKK